jgi:hypothetical protein
MDDFFIENVLELSTNGFFHGTGRAGGARLLVGNCPRSPAFQFQGCPKRNFV